ncbi:MAG: hypothetical protein IIU08_10325 [Clostridia bacterium]|nr:hypothetical protein [Clostridia bacterium]
MYRKLFGILLASVLLLSLSVLASAGALKLADVTAGHADKAPVIDGVFDPAEGWGDPVVHHDSSDMKNFAETDPGFESLMDDPALMISNLDVYMKWDDTAFYYCANVTDSEHFNPEMDAAIWRGDSIIFHVVSVPNDDSRARILFGMDNDGETWAYQETMEDGTPETSTTDKWKITRNEDTKVTTYEAYFLWEDIIPAEKLGAGGSFYLRDLFLLANKDHAEPVVAVVPEGYTDGTRNYYKITLDEAASAPEKTGPAQPVDVVEIPEKAVTVDGVISDGEWDGATRMVLNISDTSTWTEHGAGIVGTDGWSKLGHTDADFETELAFTVDGEDLYILLTRVDSTLNFASDNFHRPYSSDCALMWFFDTEYASQYGLQLLAADKSGNPIIGYFFMDSDQNSSDNLMELEYATAVTKIEENGYVMEAKVSMKGMDDLTHEMLASGTVNVTWCAVNICEEGWDSDDDQHVLWGTYNYQAQYKGVNDWDYAPKVHIAGSSSPAAPEVHIAL